MPLTPQALLQLLDRLEISYQYQEHEAVMTVAESAKLANRLPGAACKCLFLRNKEGRHFLAAVPSALRTDLKVLARALDSSRLSFGSPEDMEAMLGIRPGAVTLLAAVNDRTGRVSTVIESSLLKAEAIRFHPLVNTATVTLSPQSLLRFLDHAGHAPLLVSGIGSE